MVGGRKGQEGLRCPASVEGPLEGPAAEWLLLPCPKVALGDSQMEVALFTGSVS